MGRESGSMIREIAVLGYFLKMATMAITVSIGDSILCAILTVDVLCLVDIDLTNGQFAIGSLSSAVTTGKVVDDEGGDLVAANALDVIFNLGNLGASVAGQVSDEM